MTESDVPTLGLGSEQRQMWTQTVMTLAYGDLFDPEAPNEALMGWYRSTEGAVRSKGTMYLALHPHGEHAWGRWVGMSYDGVVVTGWGAIARTEELADKVVEDLINADQS
jgi:hypothetical protein